MSYSLAFFAEDGEHVIDDREFETVEDAWQWDANERGSRWIFYPYTFVVTESGLTIKDTVDQLDYMLGMRLKTVKRLFKEHYAKHFAEGDSDV